jgi:OFA family oxalate/formate antiporter-like MFS transporter
VAAFMAWWVLRPMRKRFMDTAVTPVAAADNNEMTTAARLAN